MVLRDGNRTIYPLARDSLDAIRDPNWLDLPPVKCMAAGLHPLTGGSSSSSSVGPSSSSSSKTQVAVMVLVMETQVLMSRVLRCDVESVTLALDSLDQDSKMTSTSNQLTGASIVTERCDGNRNVVHACVAMCAPTSNKEDNNTTGADGNSMEPINVITNALTSKSVSLREMMRRATRSATLGEYLDVNPAAANEDPIPTLSWPPESFETNSGDEDSLIGSLSQPSKSGAAGTSSSNAGNNYVLDPTERKNNAHSILKLLCENAALAPHLKVLLNAKDAQGQTPFMLAVSQRAYPAALTIMDAIQRVSKDEQDLLSMIYPSGSAPDDNPLHVLCCNDTCSFTWTGAEHINQDIFECRTCGLTGSLCCCTECAKVCHKGHDCKLKRTSPTAYCDCWEKCKCKTLIAGQNASRVELLSRLVAECSSLVSMPNSRGESILLFLVQTVGRQLVEQRQYNRNARSRTTSSRKTPSSDAEMDMPDHDLEPPRFSRKALDQLLLDWTAVKSMIMSGASGPSNSGGSHEDQTYLLSQMSTTLLDKFTHCLIVKCCTEMLDHLLSTLIREMIAEQVTGKQNNATMVARRFIRSVSRIFVVFSVEMVPSGGKKRVNTTISQPLAKCKRAFKSLLRVSVEELCETADALIAPVRLGVAKPTAPFHLASNQNDIMQGGEELFSVEPMLPHSSQASSSRAGASSTAAAAVAALMADDLGGEASVDGVAPGEDSMILQSSQRELSPVIVTRRLVARSQDMYEDNDGSEQGDSSERAIGGDVEVGGADEVGGAEPESDGEAELDLLNSESESDDNQSQHEQQNSVNQTNRGSGTGQGGSSSVGGAGELQTKKLLYTVYLYFAILIPKSLPFFLVLTCNKCLKNQVR